MFELLTKYSEGKETTFLTDFIIQNRSEAILICFNEGLSGSNEIRKKITETFDESSKKLKRDFKNNKNSVDWIDLSNAVERYKSFKCISQSEQEVFVREADAYASSRSSQIEISPLVLNNNIKGWRLKAKYIDKLNLQDLLYYNIIDFTSIKADDGTHKVLGSYFEAEKTRYESNYKAVQKISRTARNLLIQKNQNLSNQDITLKERLKETKKYLKGLKKDMPINEYKEAKCIFKFFKIFADLEKEKIKLYQSEANEATYLLCFLRPIFRILTGFQPWMKFLWFECTLKCKKDEENKLLLDSDGKATSATKIDGIIIDEVYGVEVALAEVSGPNWKVDTHHFFEDRKKLAKNLKCMYKSLISLKTGVSLDLLQEQHEQIGLFLADDKPSPESSPCCSEDDEYISPRKKMKTKCNSD
ncbi:hypothetical protein HPULCUR_003953 [Helicostylum pulchrum]|uniref:Uncharacterized protein n=1 Tax=Helicostylum pulchrum TaxID=562976 RepID=A0ABP9XWB7_9FUNG